MAAHTHVGELLLSAGLSSFKVTKSRGVVPRETLGVYRLHKESRTNV